MEIPEDHILCGCPGCGDCKCAWYYGHIIGTSPVKDAYIKIVPVVQGAAEISKITALGSIPSTGDYVHDNER